MDDARYEALVEMITERVYQALNKACPQQTAPAAAAVADRKLITEKEVSAFARQGVTELHCPAAAIVTPLAYDAARQHGICIVKENGKG